MSHKCIGVCNFKGICYIFLRLLFLLEGGVWSLKNVTISVPPAVLSGADATLRCSYDLQGAALYSIRWYRAHAEFYRYVPREMPPTRVFPLPGATVDLGASDDQQVRLRGLHRQLSGDYQCEVSADAPLFHTDIQSAPLAVVDPPLTAPQLTADRLSYTRGDVIRANCTVPAAFPAANITWYIDGRQIANNASTVHSPLEPELWEAQASTSTLELVVRESEPLKVGLSYTSASLASRDPYRYYAQESREHVSAPGVARHSVAAPAAGQLTLDCRAVIYDVYAERSGALLLKEDSPRPASVTGEDSAGVVVSVGFRPLLACLTGSVAAAILRLL